MKQVLFAVIPVSFPVIPVSFRTVCADMPLQLSFVVVGDLHCPVTKLGSGRRRRQTDGGQ